MKYSDNIVFNGLSGKLISNDNKIFLQQICNIDANNYEYVYKLDNGWAGGYLFINGNKYRYITCGSGVPIVSDVEGILNN